MIIKTNMDWQVQSDSAIGKQVASFVKQQRLIQNKTQMELAFEAGINRSTLALFESGGKMINLLTLIQLLRALNHLEVLNLFNTNGELSLLQSDDVVYEERKRAGKKRRKDINQMLHS